MEIQVRCACGQPYAFDVEPVDGKMPVNVQCPNCGADGTALANTEIQRTTAQVNEQFVAETSGDSHAAAPAAEMISTGARPGPPMSPKPARLPAGTGTLNGSALGWIGVVVGSLVGMLGWYLLLKTTGYEIGYAAWGVGMLTGWSGRKFVPQGSQSLGVFAGACAFLAIVGGQYLLVKGQFDDYADTVIETAYQKRMAFAKEALKAKSDDDLRAILTRQNADNQAKGAPVTISDEDLAKFQRDELPKLEAFTKGRPSESEFKANVRALFHAQVSKVGLVKGSLSVFTLLWLFLGVGTAYRLASSRT